MARSRDRPLLLVDVDGVISLWGFDPNDRPPGALATVDGIPHLLSSRAAEHLGALARAFALVWCTGWEERADEHLPALVGAPAGLAHLELARHAREAPTTPAHWKLPAIDAHAGADRALAWIDDAHDAACHAWARERPGPTLLVTTDPARGLTQREADVLLAWAQGGARRPSGP